MSSACALRRLGVLSLYRHALKTARMVTPKEAREEYAAEARERFRPLLTESDPVKRLACLQVAWSRICVMRMNVPVTMRPKMPEGLQQFLEAEGVLPSKNGNAIAGGGTVIPTATGELPHLVEAAKGSALLSTGQVVAGELEETSDGTSVKRRFIVKDGQVIEGTAAPADRAKRYNMALDEADIRRHYEIVDRFHFRGKGRPANPFANSWKSE